MIKEKEIIKRNVFLVFQILFTITTIAATALFLVNLTSNYFCVVIPALFSLYFGLKYHKSNKIIKNYEKGGK